MVVFPLAADFLYGLLPGNLLPLALTSLPRPPQGMLQAVGGINPLHMGEAPLADALKLGNGMAELGSPDHMPVSHMHPHRAMPQAVSPAYAVSDGFRHIPLQFLCPAHKKPPSSQAAPKAMAAADPCKNFLRVSLRLQMLSCMKTTLSHQHQRCALIPQNIRKG